MEEASSATSIAAQGLTGTVRFDGAKVSIVRQGFAGMRSGSGKGKSGIPLGAILRVDLKPANFVVNGYIEFVLAGAEQTDTQRRGRTVDATGNPNAVVFNQRSNRDFAAFRDAVQAALG